MNDVTVQDGRLVVRPRGLDRLWSLRRRLDIPLDVTLLAQLDHDGSPAAAHVPERPLAVATEGAGHLAPEVQPR